MHMTCIWRNTKPVVCYEILDQNLIINSVIYCEHLLRLKITSMKKWSTLENTNAVILHYNYARQHVSKLVKKG